MPLTKLSIAQLDTKIGALVSAYRPSQSNGDEADAGLGFAGNFHKSLKHDADGTVDAVQYAQFKTALDEARNGAVDLPNFDDELPPPNALPARPELRAPSMPERLTNPLAGTAQDLIGVLPRYMPFKPAPKIRSEQCAVEMKELYWMSLLRDLPFDRFGTSELAQAAATDLNANDGARKYLGGRTATTQSLFRGANIGGPLVGPYISQFMYQPIRFGAQSVAQRQETVAAGIDYMMDMNSCIAVQNGYWQGRVNRDMIDSEKRYIRNGRDLAHYVHIDQLYQAYFNAMLILLSDDAPTGLGNPYPTRRQKAFAVFGGPHILSLMTEVATRALKAVWHQKWFVHRRLRPEAYGLLVEKSSSAGASRIPHDALMSSEVINRIFDRTEGTKLLPMAFPEGSPTHPAYGAGHATVAGACVTVLKAWFDGSVPITRPLVPNADGSELVPYTGPGASSMTVAGELNKLAANIAIGRNFAGVHWFSDYAESIRLGERVATILLMKQSSDYVEPFKFRYTNFDGKEVEIGKRSISVAGDGDLQKFYEVHGNLFAFGDELYMYE